MGLLEKIGKFSLISINAVFQILGIVLVVMGIWAVRAYHNSEISDIHLQFNLIFIFVVVIIVGCTLAATSFFGFWAAIRENALLLKSYAWILILILFFKMWGTIFGAITSYRERIHPSNVSLIRFENIFNNYGEGSRNTEIVDAIQTKFQCCGFDRPRYVEFENGTYPWSCCGIPNQICVGPTYTEGCLQRIFEVLSPILLTISIVYYIVFAIQILCVVIAFCLSSSIRKKLAAKPVYYNL